MKTKVLLLFVLAFLSTNAVAKNADTEVVVAKYRDNFVVVVEEGLSVGSQPGVIHRSGGSSILNPDFGCFRIVIDPKRGLVQGAMPGMPGETADCAVDSLHKGEVLKVMRASFHFGYLLLDLQSLSPHSVTRGLGAFAHQSLEIGEVGISIHAGKDPDAADVLAAHWFKLATSADAVPNFGNTASGVFVNQVRVGMSFAEVERALGVPQTRIDLGEKVLYKYKDMTVEFHSGKVADVR